MNKYSFTIEGEDNHKLAILADEIRDLIYDKCFEDVELNIYNHEDNEVV